MLCNLSGITLNYSILPLLNEIKGAFREGSSYAFVDLNNKQGHNNDINNNNNNINNNNSSLIKCQLNFY